MAASSGDDIPTQLGALLGKETVRVRKTNEHPPRVSIVDVAMAVTGNPSTTRPKIFAASQLSTPKWKQIVPTTVFLAEGRGIHPLPM